MADVEHSATKLETFAMRCRLFNRVLVVAVACSLLLTVTETQAAVATTMSGVHVATMSEVVAHATGPEQVAAAKALYADVSAAEIAAALARIGQPTGVPQRLARVVVPTIEGLLVTDVYASADRISELVSMVPPLATPVTLARSDGVRSSLGRWTATASSVDGWSATNESTSDATECDACAGVGIVGGALYSTIVCFGGGFWTILVCNIASSGVGIASDDACRGFFGCPGGTPRGMELNKVLCGLDYCDYGIRVHKQGDTVIELGDTTYWYYPYAAGHGAYADKRGGISAVVHHDEAYSDLQPSIDTLSPEHPLYEWRQGTSEPEWVACATDLQVSFTVRFENSSLQTTGWLKGQKPSATTCPGYRTY